ncbi:MAG: hypothetical protein NQU46_04960 [Methanolinea sp.]|nr:hypothetical protein [Methanolinea sp.]
MVLEETLRFDSAEGADAFIKYLRKKGCKAHKKTVAGFFETIELEGTIDNFIAFLEDLLEREDDEEEEDWLDDEEEEEEEEFDRDAVEGRLEKLKKARARLENILGSHGEGDVLFTEADLDRHGDDLFEHMAQAVFPVMQQNLKELGIDLPPREQRREVADEEVEEAGIFLAVFDILDDNKLLEKDKEGNYRLVRKIPVEQCRVKMSGFGLGGPDQEELDSWEISSCTNIVMDSQHEVVMEGTVVVEFSVDDIEEGLIGLDVDAESLDAFYSAFEMKRLAVMALFEVVGGAGRISFEDLRERLKGYMVQSDVVEEPVKVTLEEDFLSSLVTDLRKLGYLAGSTENIRLAR